MTLIDEMNNCLPIYAYPTKQLLENAEKYKLTLKSKLKITSFMDGAYEGGIMCVIEMENEVLFTSLTHLEFRDEHPLKYRINAYKKDRIDSLKAESAVRSSSVGRNDLCVCGSGKKYKKCCGKNIR